MSYKRKDNQGYTLIEFLTVLVILVIVSSVISAMIFSVLQGSSRSRLDIALSQNGNYALSVISNIILASQSVVDIDGNPVENCVGTKDVNGNMVYPSGSSITVQRSNGDSTILTFTSSANPPNISSASAALTEAGVPNAGDLLDSSEVQLDTSAGRVYRFVCKQSSPYALPLILVQFSLVPVSVPVGNSSTLSQPFETQVLMENFQNN